MTVDELLAEARLHTNHEDDAVCEFAKAVIDLLAEATPCGYEEPEVRPGIVGIPNSWAQDWATPNESRGYARMLLRGADEAESPTTEQP